MIDNRINCREGRRERERERERESKLYHRALACSTRCMATVYNTTQQYNNVMCACL